MNRLPGALALLLILFSQYAPSLLGQPAWEPVGPLGANIFDIDVSGSGTLYVTADGNAYIRRVSDSLWRTFPYYDSLSSRHRTHFSIVTVDDIVMLIGSESQFYLSEDDGVTWQKKEDLPKERIDITHPTAVRINDTIFLLGPERNSLLMASTDKGSTWSRVDTVNVDTRMVTDGHSLYFYSGRGLFQRVDGVISEISPPLTYAVSFAIIGDTIFIGTIPSGEQLTYLRSPDRGATWSRSPLEPKIVAGVLDGELVAFDNEGVYVSGPFGESWNIEAESDYPIESWRILLPFNEGLLASTGRGILRFERHAGESTLEHWSENMYGLEVSHLYPYGDSVLALVKGVVPFVGRPDGTSWKAPDIDFTSRRWFITDDRTIYMTGKDSTQLFRTRDIGATWDTLRGGSGTGRISSIYADGRRIVTFDEDRKVRTSGDAGDTWTSLSTDVVPYTLFGEGDTLFGSLNLRGEKLLRSLDGGIMWDTVQTPFGTRGPFHVSRGVIVVNTARVLMRSTNLGETWDTLTVLADGDSGPEVQDPQRTTIVADTIFVATRSTTLYRSTDLGETWQRLADPPYISECLLQFGGSLLSGFSLRSMWRLELNGMTGSVEEAERALRQLDLW